MTTKRVAAGKPESPGLDGVRRLRVAIVYDCLYPHTIGGAERWYRELATRLARHHEVTYLTRVQWRGRPDAPPGVRVVGISGGRRLYAPTARRRILPPLRFGLGVLAHLLGNRGRYDLVHTCSFPYFPLLAASFVQRVGGPVVVTDWLEVWSPAYWRDYLGPLGGWFGRMVQAACIRRTGPAFTFSQLAADSLRSHGYRRAPIILSGMLSGIHAAADPNGVGISAAASGSVPAAGSVDAFNNDSRMPQAREPLLVYVGRHIPEKRVPALVAALDLARRRLPALRAIIFGDGPERPRVQAEIARLGLSEVVACPGFAPWAEVDSALRRALVLVLPSQREGYGLVVVEAAARGTPSIVVAGPDNAATALIEDGVNGFIAPDPGAQALADAIVAADTAGAALVASTQAWFLARAPALGIEASVARIEAVYRELVPEVRPAKPAGLAELTGPAELAGPGELD